MKQQASFIFKISQVVFLLLFAAHVLMLLGSPLLENALVSLGVLFCFFPCAECWLLCRGLKNKQPDCIGTSLMLHHFFSVYFLLRMVVQPVYTVESGIINHHPYVWIGASCELILILVVYGILLFQQKKAKQA